MNPITYTEGDNGFVIRYITLYSGRKALEIGLNNDSITIIAEGERSKNIETAQIKEITYSVEQSSMPRNSYSESMQVIGEIYFPVEGDYLEILTIRTIELTSLLLRETQTFKVTELVANRIADKYNIPSKFQYEIVTKQKTKMQYRGVLWGIFLVVLVLIYFIIREIK